MKLSPGSERTEPVVTVWLNRVNEDPRTQARALLMHAVAAALGLPATAIEVDREPGGRPRLVGAAAGLHIAVSHTRGAVAVATSPHAPIGVDVEAVRALPGARLARRWMLPAEADWVANQPSHRQQLAFLLLWTSKEAIGKARGRGLRAGGLRQPVALPHFHPGDDPVLRPVPGDNRMIVAANRVGADFVLAVACASGDIDASYVVHDLHPVS